MSVNIEDYEELQYRINLILEEEFRAYSHNGRSRGGLGSYNVKLPQQWVREGEVPSLLGSPNQDAINSPNEVLLLKLHNSLKAHEKPLFIEHLKLQLQEEGEYSPVAYLIFRVLYKLGQLVPTLEYAKDTLKDAPQHAWSNLLGMLSQTVIHEYAYLNWPTLRRIKELLASGQEFHLIERINAAEVKTLEAELGDINPEINKDREKVKSLWEEKFGNTTTNVTQLINEIEEYFTEGELTQAKFSTCMGRVRVLLTGTSQEMATAKAKENNEELPKGDKAGLKYLQKKKVISEKEYGLLVAIYNLTSDKGAHSSSGLKEQARITKNITYEALLMLLVRLV